ncbi:hypothetical protein E5161_00865 [Cohnella pontilimi]|uniref:HNH endonuclease n=1 Tax=Cohnella pontilimi TaxID=2564100 RepID=A0A4U0FGE2_9BACL|nr:hypothetical protein [Cohnella pontilimi]TJY43981.1 hypothetical protein E5161_00865 [Cohnella pontilimi]
MEPKRYTRKRNELLNYLPRTLTAEQITEAKKKAVCALTGSADDVTLDHFIPLEWGHGGEYIGNIYFIQRKLNASKSNWNPFKWIKKLALTGHVDMKRWDQLVLSLAAQNGLNVKEFRRFVNWCEKNKRSKDQLMADNRPSLELWMKLQNHHP